MVAFDAGNYHGVEAVLSGKRCALALWFTLSHAHREMSQEYARDRIVALKNMEANKNEASGPTVEPFVDDNTSDIHIEL